ncbi:lipoprotein [Sphaerisporangium siamense]|uniref:GerMN domain-containing protein n=1 Tax=Sphaerisporangium siamense TaxID=795645 RepID=A0A7W7DG32_9ACTN|nr:LpqB family beta-propeller domain-containing protein [Sphaerisporangium siamense]MBB4705844.1 hypothetical protein [Sphaerisporangium siamense]GII82763.1 lipoprotein [Sphaerisporangium siamense]
MPTRPARPARPVRRTGPSGPVRLTLGASLGAALALLSACSTVPTGGNPFTARGPAAKDPLSQPYVRILAAPPKPNGEPIDIVNGFLAAAAGFDDPQRTVARQYLTDEARRAWDPTDAVVIYDQPKSPTQVVEETQAHITMKALKLGALDADGHYVPADASSGGELTEEFKLIKVGGQWRISAAPTGLLLSDDDFKRAYRAYDLYFPAYDQKVLVTDQVLVPIDPEQGLAKSLVQRMLVGPTTPLRDAVVPAFGHDVDVNDVTVEDDTVVVDFTYGIVDSARVTAQKMALSAQLSWTLKPLTESRSIEVRVNGEQFPGGPFVIDPRAYASFDPNVVTSSAQALFLRQGKPYLVDKDHDQPLDRGAEPARQFTALAVGKGLSTLALLDKTGAVWVTGEVPGSPWQRWMQAAGLTAPSWDRYDQLWSVAKLGPRRSQVLRARDATGAERVPAPALESSDVKAFRVSRDGARVAVIADDGRGDRVLVGSIDRSRPEVENVRPLVPAAEGQEIVDIAWRDASTLLVLTQSKSDRELATWSVTRGSRSDTPKAAARIVTITAAPEAAPVFAGTSDGEVLMWDPQKRQWTSVEKNGAATPKYPLG